MHCSVFGLVGCFGESDEVHYMQVRHHQRCSCYRCACFCYIYAVAMLLLEACRSRLYAVKHVSTGRLLA